MKRLAEHKRVSQQKLIAEALDLLFEKHGLRRLRRERRQYPTPLRRISAETASERPGKDSK
jgi:hypothetical protein